MSTRLAVAMGAAAMPALALAAPPLPFTGSLSPYYTYQVQLPTDSTRHFSGSGAGVSGWMNLPYNLFLDGRYQWNNEFVPPQGGFFGSPGAHLDQRQARLGGGIQFFVPYSPLTLYGKIDYVHYGATLRSGGVDYGHVNDDGTGYFGGLRLGQFGYRLYAEGGYVSLSDSDGPQALVGLDLPLGQRVKLFLEYQYNDFGFNDGSGQHLRIDDYRVGLRLPFGP